MAASNAYPEIDALLSVIRKHHIRIEAIPQRPEETEISHRRLELNAGRKKIIIPVDDEFEDVRKEASNTALMLHLILRACIDYEAAEDYLVWCKEAGLPAAQPGLRQMYFELREAVPVLQELINDAAAPLSHWDFSMNTGVTQALRALCEK